MLGSTGEDRKGHGRNARAAGALKVKEGNAWKEAWMSASGLDELLLAILRTTQQHSETCSSVQVFTS